MIRRPPRSTLFPTRRSSDLSPSGHLVQEDRVHGYAETLRAPVAREPSLKRTANYPFTREFPKLFRVRDRKSTRLNSSHSQISYAVFCLKKKQQYVPHKDRIC